MNVKNLRVRDIMQTRVKTIRKGATLSEAAEMMKKNNVSSLIIEPEADWDAFGIITRKDVIEALMEDPACGATRMVGGTMSKPAITVNTDLSVFNCHLLMRTIGIRRVPVVDGHRLAGILSNSDIFKKLVKSES